MRGYRSLLLPAVLTLLWLGWACSSAALEPVVAATFIVKPSGANPAARHIQEVLRGAAFAPEAVAPWLDSIAKSIGAPLEAERVTSGAELVLRIPRAAALAQIAGHVEADPAVDAVTTRPDPADTPFADQDRLLIHFAADTDAAAVLARQDAGSQEEEVAALAESLLRSTPYVAQATVESDGTLQLMIDWAGTAERVAEQLRARPDIEYVQIERMLRAWGP